MGGPKQAPRETTTTTKPKATVTRFGYQHGGGASLLKPQIYEELSVLGDEVEEMFVSDRIVDPLYVFVTSENGWSANVGAHVKAQALRDNATNSKMMSKKTVELNPTHSTRTELKEARRTSLTRDETERAEIVEVAHTIPQERRILD